ncbi:MAG: P13 family porin [Spirochaetales bacterium]|nr:P13 family porin [Spirochaetales bacterium]
MKRLLLLIIILLAVSSVAFASEDNADREVRKFQLQNTFIGFGVGSRHQGDKDNAKLLLGLDITGTTLAVTGGLSLAGSIIVYNGLRAMVGEVTPADIWISAGVLSSGVIMLIVSRILGWNMPLRY